MSFLEAFLQNICRSPDQVALEFIDPPLQRLTYAELDQLVLRTVGYLQSFGLQRGDRVALQLPKCLEFILLHLAAARMGAITLPLNPAYPPDETEYFLGDSEARLYFAPEASIEKLQPALARLPDLQEAVQLAPLDADDFRSRISRHTVLDAILPTPDPDDTAVIIYTSGTTGRPKGAEIMHGNLSANLASLHTAWGWQADDVLLHVLPLFHVHGLFVALHGALHAGATTLLMREFDAERTLRNLIDRKCTVFMAVPTIHKRLLDAPEAGRYDLSHLRLITSGSDRLPDEVFTGFQRTFGYTLLERYGMSETGMNLSNPLHGERRLGSVGLPLPGVEVRVVDSESGQPLPDGEVGELQVRGANVLKRYWQQPQKTAEAFAEGGWFRTGDLGFREPDGYFNLQGRAKDLIITGGLNVYPPEVERVLAEHPAVAACAVIGCQDPDWGERIVAVVVLNKGMKVLEQDLVSYCREHLAAYKAPRQVVFVNELPRNAMGKVQKGELRSSVCSGKAGD